MVRPFLPSFPRQAVPQLFELLHGVSFHLLPPQCSTHQICVFSSLLFTYIHHTVHYEYKTIVSTRESSNGHMDQKEPSTKFLRGHDRHNPLIDTPTWSDAIIGPFLLRRSGRICATGTEMAGRTGTLESTPEAPTVKCMVRRRSAMVGAPMRISVHSLTPTDYSDCMRSSNRDAAAAADVVAITVR